MELSPLQQAQTISFPSCWTMGWQPPVWVSEVSDVWYLHDDKGPRKLFTAEMLSFFFANGISKINWWQIPRPKWDIAFVGCSPSLASIPWMGPQMCGYRGAHWLRNSWRTHSLGSNNAKCFNAMCALHMYTFHNMDSLVNSIFWLKCSSDIKCSLRFAQQ